MADIESVSAYWLDCKTLQVECPYCRRIHCHCADRSPYNDIRPSNCMRKHLPKKRDKPLYYRLGYGRARAAVRGDCVSEVARDVTVLGLIYQLV
jgi:hypothetical protein